MCMRPPALTFAGVTGFALGCSGIELFPDVEVRDATLETAREHFRVPDGASHVDGLHRTSIDVDWVQVCFTATPELIEAQRAEAQRKGAERVDALEPPESWPDWEGIFDWGSASWWPTRAEEVWRWDRAAGDGDDLGYGVMWTIDGDRACVWSWNFQWWTP